MEAPADTTAQKPGISLHGLICEEMQMNPPNFGNVATGDLERACYQFDVAHLEAILRKYIGTEDMYTQQYLYGAEDNIKLLEDIGKAVETTAAAQAPRGPEAEGAPLRAMPRRGVQGVASQVRGRAGVRGARRGCRAARSPYAQAGRAGCLS